MPDCDHCTCYTAKENRCCYCHKRSPSFRTGKETLTKIKQLNKNEEKSSNEVEDDDSFFIDSF